MSIRCVCPNGHVLKVKDSMAGTSGLCPICRATVKVPLLREHRMTEDAILDIVGPGSGVHSMDTTRDLRAAADTRVIKNGISDVRERLCTKCQREFPATMHICPYCHTYVATLRDF